MLEKMKNTIAYIVYEMYQKGILKNSIHVHSIDETIDALIDTNNSLVRFGEGEIIMIEGLATATQESNAELGGRLKEILKHAKEDDILAEDTKGQLLVSIYDVFEGVEQIRPQNRDFWRRHLLQSRRTYEDNLDCNRVYENTFLTRCYYSFDDKSRCAEWFERIKTIWKDQNIILVEGECSHNGVDNDLLGLAKSVKRIIGPAQNAYRIYDKIYEACSLVARSEEEEVLFLLSLGATAKPLAYDLYQKGYRVIDIGNLDMEYGWFLMGIEEKYDFPKYGVIGYDANYEAGYFQYLDEIVATIGC